MLRPQLFLTVWLVLGFLYYHVAGMEENHTPECGEYEYLSDDGSECHPCQELTCEAGFQPNRSCGNGNQLTGAACTRCEDGHFSKAGEDCQRCSVCRNTVNDTPCTRESDIVCGPCKKGYVMLGFHCRRCSQVPYPSHYEECRDKEAIPGDDGEKPVPYTVAESVGKTSPQEDKGSDLPWNSLLIVIILAGLILLVGLVALLGILFCCNYKRHGLCGGTRSHRESIESGGQEREGQVPDAEIGEGDALIDENLTGTQPVQRQTASEVTDHPNGVVKDILLQGGNDSCDGQQTSNGESDQPSTGLVMETPLRGRDDSANGQLQVNGTSDEHPDGGRVREPHLEERNDSHDLHNGHTPAASHKTSADDECNRQHAPLQPSAPESSVFGDRSDLHGPHSAHPSAGSYRQGGAPSHMGPGFPPGTRAGVHIGSVQNFFYNNCGNSCSHPPLAADGPGEVKFNPSFDPAAS